MPPPLLHVRHCRTLVGAVRLGAACTQPLTLLAKPSPDTIMQTCGKNMRQELKKHLLCSHFLRPIPVFCVSQISYRKLSCDDDLGSQAAPNLSNPTPDPYAHLKPTDLDCGVQQPSGTDRKTSAGSSSSPTPSPVDSGVCNLTFPHLFPHQHVMGYLHTSRPEK